MKSPWKFLLDLASRGDAAERPESAPNTEIAKPHAPFSAPNAPFVAPVSTDDAAISIEPASNEVASNLASKTPDTASSKKRSTIPPDRARTDERAGPSKRKPIKRQSRAGKSSARNVAAAAGVEYGHGNAEVQLPAMTFSDEVAALDEEVRQLRRQLAEVLSLQNAQLKKMLERF